MALKKLSGSIDFTAAALIRGMQGARVAAVVSADKKTDRRLFSIVSKLADELNSQGKKAKICANAEEASKSESELCLVPITKALESCNKIKAAAACDKTVIAVSYCETKHEELINLKSVLTLNGAQIVGVIAVK